MKRIFPAIYFLWISMLLLYVGVSLYSYYSVRGTFGWVPGNDTIFEMASEMGQRIKVFPTEWGIALIYFYISSMLLIPLIIVIHYSLFRANRAFIFNRKPAIVLACTWCAVWLLMQFSEPVSWYFQFALD